MNLAVDKSKQIQPGSGWKPGFISILLACIVGGFLGGAVVCAVHPLFPYKDLPQIGLDASAELVQQHREAVFEFRSRNYCADLGIVGLTLGLSFGACAGGARRLIATIAGGVAGALLGAGLGFVGGLYIAKTILLNAEQTLQESLGLQTIVWSLILAGIVWSVAAANVGAVLATRYGFVGLLAGFAVTVTQFIVSSLVFPASNPLFLVPERSSERIYWLIAFPIISGLILAFGLRRQQSEPVQAKEVMPAES